MPFTQGRNQRGAEGAVSYPPSYLILSHSSSWKSYFCKKGKYKSKFWKKTLCLDSVKKKRF